MLKFFLKFTVKILVIAIIVIGGAWYLDSKGYIDLSPYVDEYLGEYLAQFGREDENILEYAINTDLSSNLTLVGKTPQGSEYAVFTKKVGASQPIDNIVWKMPDERIALFEFNDAGQVSEIEFEEHVFAYSNYVGNRADITVTQPDGSVEIHTNVDLSRETAAYFIPAAHANAFATPPDTQTIKDYFDTGDQTYLEFISNSPGTATNIFLCGVFTVYFPPLAVGQCGQTLVRVVTNYVDIGPCEGDVLDCAFNAFKENLKNPGPSMGGIVTERGTDNPISGASIVLKNRTGDVERRAQSGAYGHFHIPDVDIGGYVLEVSAAGQPTESFPLAVTDDIVKIQSGGGKVLLDVDYDVTKRKYFKKIPDYFGNETDVPHTVRFDVELGEEGSFDGIWSGKATTSIKETPEAYCTGGTIHWEISGSMLQGKALAYAGYQINLTGDVASSGDVKGSGTAEENSVNFEATINTDGTGAGSWSDTLGCYGTFSVTNDALQEEFIRENNASGEVEPIY